MNGIWHVVGDDALAPKERGSHILQGRWAGRCPVCNALHWLDTGFAWYWPDGEVKGWNAWGPRFGGCVNGCKVPSGEWREGAAAGVEPVEFEEQQMIWAAYLLGGDRAVAELAELVITERY